jgi:hypothetical protein
MKPKFTHKNCFSWFSGFGRGGFFSRVFSSHSSAYLKKYDLLNGFIKNYIDMPDNLVDLLIRFLSQNDGKLSKRAKEIEFEKLTDNEIQAIEGKYSEIYG